MCTSDVQIPSQGRYIFKMIGCKIYSSLLGLVKVLINCKFVSSVCQARSDWTKFKYYAAYKNYKRGWALPGMQERRVMDLSL